MLGHGDREGTLAGSGDAVCSWVVSHGDGVCCFMLGSPLPFGMFQMKSPEPVSPGKDGGQREKGELSSGFVLGQ